MKSISDKALFIVIEGIDGSGKSTQMNLLNERFQNMARAVHTTHEPTDSETGRFIRNILRNETALGQESLAALFLADRLEHITNPECGILARIGQGETVISDRYYFSNLAFQSEYVPMDWLMSINSLCKEMLIADFTFYLNIDPAICYQRIIDRNESLEMYETPGKLERTHQAFLYAFEKYSIKENIHIINADRAKESIHEEIWAIINGGRN
jgi:dTMP kinase